LNMLLEKGRVAPDGIFCRGKKIGYVRAMGTGGEKLLQWPLGKGPGKRKKRGGKKRRVLLRQTKKEVTPGR